jgi:hypothetical protein
MASPPRKLKHISTTNAHEKIRACSGPRAARKLVAEEIRRGTLTATGFATYTHNQGKTPQKDPLTLTGGWWDRIEADDQLKDFWAQGTVSLSKTKKAAKVDISGIMLDAERLDEILAPYEPLPPTGPSGKSRKGANAYRHGEPVTYVAQYLAALPPAERNKMTAKRLGHILGQAYEVLGYDPVNQRNLDGIAAGILHALRNPIDLPKMIQDCEKKRQTEAASRR